LLQPDAQLVDPVSERDDRRRGVLLRIIGRHTLQCAPDRPELA
jgi:hypothetical protein